MPLFINLIIYTLLAHFFSVFQFGEKTGTKTEQPNFLCDFCMEK